MELTLPVLVSVDRRELYSVMLPGISSLGTQRGPSLARLLDELTLHLMEAVPKMAPADAASLVLSPYIELRRVKVEVALSSGRQAQHWKGRLPVILERWPKDRFITAILPYLGGRRFAVQNTAALQSALERFLSSAAQSKRAPITESELEAATCRVLDYLELLPIDVDLPTILPSRPKKRTKKRRATKGRSKKKTDKKPPEKKRVIVTPRTLSQVAENLTHRSLDGRLDRAYFRDAIVDDVVRHLSREGAAIVLVGEAGVGKTAIVHEVVRRLLDNSTSLKDRRDVWQVDGNRIIAGMSVVGAWEHRVTSMVNELNARQDVLFVNDLPALVYTGRSAHSDTNVAEFLEPHLGRGEVRILGECTPQRLAILQDEAPGFFARFRVIQIPELSEQDTLHVLLHVVRRLDSDEPLAVHPAGLEMTVALSRRFRALEVHPGKSVDLLSRAIADRTDATRDQFGRRVIDSAKIVDHFARQAGLPKYLLFGEGGPNPSDIRAFFERRIVGQPEAINAAVDVVTTASQALNDPTRPFAAMLFVGPTGVGKTETAKALAEYLFGSKERLVRFDMSEFQHPHSVSRLIGDRIRPDGELTRRVQQQPFSLILLDEVEKAHPAIFDAMLQVLGEGRLTNAAGTTVSFTTTIIIMTSNLGVREADKTVGFEGPNRQALAAHYRSAAETFFRPEFFNRIDRVVAFRALDRDVIVPLVGRLLAQMLSRQGLKRSSVLVDVDPELAEVLVDQGFDRRYGARSVKRILEHRLAVPLSKHLVTDQSSDLRLVEVYPRAGELGLSIELPSSSPVTAVKGAQPPKNWKQVEARHAGLRLALEAITGSDDIIRHRDEHETLLDALNRDALTDAGQRRLLSIAAIQQNLTELTESLDRFEDDLLTVEQFVIERTHDVVAHKDYGTRMVAVDNVRPQRAARPPLRDAVVHRLETTELQMARIDYQLQALSLTADERILVRFRCGRPRPLAATLIQWLAAWGPTESTGPAGAFRPWGASATVFMRGKQGWTNLESVLGGDIGLGTVATAFEGSAVESAALEFKGRALRQLLDPELGLWIWQHQLGPDYHLDLVRIEDVGSNDEPIERLAALDASEEGVRLARRQGEVDGPIAKRAPIRRWFDNGHHECRQTGVVHRDEYDSTFLLRVVLRRLHAEMMHRVLHKDRTS